MEQQNPNTMNNDNTNQQMVSPSGGTPNIYGNHSQHQLQQNQLQHHQHPETQTTQIQQQPSIANNNLRMENPCYQEQNLRNQQENQLSFSSEDLLNLLLELDNNSTDLMNNAVTLDQDERHGIEAIRKQLMSCEVQSDPPQYQQQQLAGSVQIPVNSSDKPQTGPQATNMDAVSYQQQQTSPHTTSHVNMLQEHATHQQEQSAIDVAKTTPPILQSPTQPASQYHQQQVQHPHMTSYIVTTVANTSESPSVGHSQLQHRLSVDQSSPNNSYSPVNYINVQESNQPYVIQAESPNSSTATGTHNPNQNNPATRINQNSTATSGSLMNESPSPSWHQHRLSVPLFSQQQQQQQHSHLFTAIQQEKDSSQTISPPTVTTKTNQQVKLISQTPMLIDPSEPSPVVKKNPLLNAQLVNSPRATSNQTSSRFFNSNQSQQSTSNLIQPCPPIKQQIQQTSSFIHATPSNTSTVSSPLSPQLNLQQQNNLFTQQQQQLNQYQKQTQISPNAGYSDTSYRFDLYDQSGGSSSAQFQTPEPYFGGSNGELSNISVSPIMNSPLSPLEDNIVPLSGDKRQRGHVVGRHLEARRTKVQQPKQQQSHHQTTSLLKQLLSDDNT